jgi:hypothetical protein
MLYETVRSCKESVRAVRKTNFRTTALLNGKCRLKIFIQQLFQFRKANIHLNTALLGVGDLAGFF